MVPINHNVNSIKFITLPVLDDKGRPVKAQDALTDKHGMKYVDVLCICFDHVNHTSLWDIPCTPASLVAFVEGLEKRGLDTLVDAKSWRELINYDYAKAVKPRVKATA